MTSSSFADRAFKVTIAGSGTYTYNRTIITVSTSCKIIGDNNIISVSPHIREPIEIELVGNRNRYLASSLDSVALVIVNGEYNTIDGCANVSGSGNYNTYIKVGSLVFKGDRNNTAECDHVNGQGHYNTIMAIKKGLCTGEHNTVVVTEPNGIGTCLPPPPTTTTTPSTTTGGGFGAYLASRSSSATTTTSGGFANHPTSFSKFGNSGYASSSGFGGQPVATVSGHPVSSVFGGNGPRPAVEPVSLRPPNAHTFGAPPSGFSNRIPTSSNNDSCGRRSATTSTSSTPSEDKVLEHVKLVSHVEAQAKNDVVAPSDDRACIACTEHLKRATYLCGHTPYCATCLYKIVANFSQQPEQHKCPICKQTSHTVIIQMGD